MSQVEYYDYSKPTSFLILSRNSVLFLYLLSIIFISATIYLISLIIDVDYQQGFNYCIIYIHVPSAWLSMMLYVAVTILAVIYLLYKNPIIKGVIQTILLIGSVMTFITLVTGSLWGKVTWGTYWVWDVRLTSVLVLFLIYIFNYIIVSSISNIYVSSFSIILGSVTIPIIKIAVEWWNTLHQPASIIQMDSKIHITTIIPLYYMLFLYICFILIIIVYDVRNYILKYKIINN